MCRIHIPVREPDPSVDSAAGTGPGPGTLFIIISIVTATLTGFTTKKITPRPRTLSALPKVAEETIGDELKDGRGEAKAKEQS